MPKICQSSPLWQACGANKKDQHLLTTPVGQEHLNLAKQLHKTQRGNEIDSLHKETMEQLLANTKEKHSLRMTHHRDPAPVSTWVRLQFAAMDLKKPALWCGRSLVFPFHRT